MAKAGLIRQARKAFALLLGPGVMRAGEAVLLVGVSMALVRVMSVGDFGRFSFLFAAVRLFCVPMVQGTSNLLVREVPRHIRLGEDGEAHHAVRWSTRAALLWVIPASIATLLTFCLSKLFDGEVPWLATAVLVLAFCLSGPFTGAARSLKMPAFAMLPASVLAPVIFVACLYPVWQSGSVIDWNLAALLRGAIFLSAVVFAFAAIAYSARGKAIRRTPPSSTPISTRMLIPFAVVGTLQYFNQQAGTLIAGFTTDEEAVALYRAAAQFAAVLSMVPATINLVAMPYISESAQLDAPEKTRKILFRAMAGTWACTAIGLLAMILVGEWLLATAFGAAFAPAYQALLILCAGTAFASGGAFTLAYLNLSGRQKRLMIAVVLSALLQVVLSLMLVGPFGIEGIAAAATIALSLNAVVTIAMALRALKPDPDSPANRTEQT